MPSDRSSGSERTLRRLRFGRAMRAGAVAIGLMVLIALDRSGWLLYRSDMQRYDGRSFTVVSVIDGDTLDIAEPDGKSPTTRVRLWGIDTPELAHRDPPTPAEPFAAEAHAIARQLCEGQAVTLHLEADRLRGRYGRLLAHVELSDGTTLNERLLSLGLAAFDARFMHSRYEAYRRRATDARQAGVGLYDR